MHLPTLVFIVPAAVCVLSWIGIGSTLPRSWLPADRLLAALTRVGLGSVAWSLVIFALGRVNLLDRWLIVALTAVAAFAGLAAVMRLSRRLRVRAPSRFEWVLLGAVAVALVLDLVAATAPVTSADALTYHLALPKLWLENGSIGNPFWLWQGFGPSDIEMLYTQGLAVGGASAAATLDAFLAVGCALAIYGLGRSVSGGSSLAGAAAAFLFTLQGIVTWEATSAFIELGLTFYSVLAVWQLWAWWRTPSRWGACWLGVFGGAAAGTKYLGLVVLALTLLVCAVGAIRRHRAGDIVVAGTAALSVGGWWYLRNAIVTGNPLYPLVFGGKWLTTFATQQIHQAYATYGLGGGAARLALLPVDLVIHGGAFDRGQYVGTAIFVFALVGLFVGRRRVWVALWLGVLVFLVVWHAQSQQARFLLPALAVLAAVAGGAVAACWQSGTVGKFAAGTVLAVAAVAWLVSSGALTRQLIPVTVGAESHDAFVQRLTGTYDAFRAARANVGPRATVGLAGYPFTFNFPGRAVSLSVPAFVPTLDRKTFLERAHQLGVQSLLVGGGLGEPELAAVKDCLKLRAVYHARYVTSRSLAHSVPYDLDLYSLAGCTT